MNGRAQFMKMSRLRTTRWIVGLSLAACIALAAMSTGVYQGEQQAYSAERAPELYMVPYASTFMECSREINWPWELLAALAWTESHFNPKAKSGVGARGVMQLMPQTGQYYGLNDSTFFLPEDNIRAGAEYIRSLQRKFSFVTDSAQQWRFVVASYNSGPGYIFAARREAREAGVNPDVWENVAEYIPYGETRNHVRKVERTYQRIRKGEKIK